MQSIITLKKILRSTIGISLSIFMLLSFSAITGNAQTTLTTTFANNNGNSLVTFNFTNNNTSAVILTNIGGVTSTAGPIAVSAYSKPSAITGAPGAISVANGWTSFGSATITGIPNTTTSTPQPFLSGLSLVIPAGATYGIAVEAPGLRYSTLAAGTFTTTGGGAVLTTGTNIGFGGGPAPAAPTFTPRGFIGSVTFMSAVPCSGTPNPGATNSTSTSVCPTDAFTLSPANATSGTGVTYQWQSGPSASGTFTNIVGATSPTYTTTQSASTYYRVVVTCGANSGTSTPVLVSRNTNTITSSPSNASASCDGNSTFTVAASGTSTVYQWEYRINATSPWILITNTPPYSGANTATLTVTNVNSTMNGYQYRAIVSGPCTGPDFSAIATLTVTPLVATVSPASATICAGSIQQLSITNTAPPTTVQFCSGNINLAIPDLVGPPASTPAAADAGINHSIPVVIPAGALIASMNVKLNVTHSYVGDLVVVLKAPNGKILNLVYHKSGTGTAGANFTNTVISSAGIAAISSGTPPFTGTFKADASIGAGSFADAAGSGPTAFQPDVTTWNPLYSIPNGNWTIAIADHQEWAGDAGVLNNWCIEFNYGAPATGIFTGPAGTIFTDPLATVPYNGTTPINTVYVKPTASANYSVIVSTAACVSGPTTIPVNVNTPAGGTPTLSNTSVCVGSNTFFKPGGTLTGGPGFVHNYQVKTTAPGATFTNITPGGVYSTNGDSLKLTNVPLSFNGYQFRDSISTGGNCGSKISTVATLSVNPIPVVKISVAPVRNLFPGLTTTLTAMVIANGTPPITYQWFRNGVAVPGATNNTLVVGIDGLGSYTVKATAQGCSNADSTTTPQNIVIGDSTGVKTLFIYPSPNSGQFQVRYFSDINNGSKSPAQVNVYDQKGARVFTRNYGLSSGYQPMNVDLGTHSRGIYRVELTDLNGERIKTGTVLVF